MGKTNKNLSNEITIILLEVTCQMTHYRGRINKYGKNVTMNTNSALHSMSICNMTQLKNLM